MTQKDLSVIKQDIKIYIEDNPKLNNTKLAEKFITENDVKLTVRSIRRYISLLKEAEEGLEDEVDTVEAFIKGPDIVENVEDVRSTNYEEASRFESFDALVTDNEEDAPSVETEVCEFNYTDVYTTTIKGTIYSFKYDLIDKIYCGYSRRGLNLTSAVVQQLVDLDVTELGIIMRNLRITKDSMPYSVYSQANLNEALLYNLLEKNIDYMLDKLQQSDGSTNTKLNKLYKKFIILQQNNDLKFRSLISDIKAELPNVSIDRDQFMPRYGTSRYPIIHLFIPDMHIGMNQDNYNIEIIKNQLKYVITTVNKIEAGQVNVHFMGDIIHSVSGLNHKDSWKNMAQGTSGAEAIIQPYKLLSTFLRNIDNIGKVDFVGGNHDRLASNKAEDSTAEGAKLIAYMLDETFTNITIEFDPYRIVDNTDPALTIITLHGDKPIDKASGQSIAWEYGDSSKFNYIAVAHMHSRRQNPTDDGLRFRKESFPAFCPSDTYSKTVAHGSMPGFKIVYVDQGKAPTILDIPLTYDD